MKASSAAAKSAAATNGAQHRRTPSEGPKKRYRPLPRRQARRAESTAIPRQSHGGDDETGDANGEHDRGEASVAVAAYTTMPANNESGNTALVRRKPICRNGGMYSPPRGPPPRRSLPPRQRRGCRHARTGLLESRVEAAKVVRQDFQVVLRILQIGAGRDLDDNKVEASSTEIEERADGPIVEQRSQRHNQRLRGRVRRGITATSRHA